jgi:hypothetical protein
MRRLPFSILNYAGRKPWFLEHAERFAGKGEIAYTLAPESPGHNLYRVCEVDHPQLLKILAKWKGRWQLTSEFCPEIFALLKNAGLDDQSISTYVVPMQTGHGARKMELVVSREQRDVRRK